FSQLSEQLNMNRVKTKSYWGFITRTKIKILSHNILFFINKLLGNDKDMAKIKSLIFG
ncbi:IS982 family transposase, partial [Tepidibacter sp. Z1-5]